MLADSKCMRFPHHCHNGGFAAAVGPKHKCVGRIVKRATPDVPDGRPDALPSHAVFLDNEKLLRLRDVAPPRERNARLLEVVAAGVCDPQRVGERDRAADT